MLHNRHNLSVHRMLREKPSSVDDLHFGRQEVALNCFLLKLEEVDCNGQGICGAIKCQLSHSPISVALCHCQYSRRSEGEKT